MLLHRRRRLVRRKSLSWSDTVGHYTMYLKYGAHRDTIHALVYRVLIAYLSISLPSSAKVVDRVSKLVYCFDAAQSS
jgi:hypothetical protein